MADLVELDRLVKKKVAVVGDPITDVWVDGVLQGCQDGCPKFLRSLEVATPGGALGAARQLGHWGCEVDVCGPAADPAVKTRFVDDATGRVVFRVDREQKDYGLSRATLLEQRDRALKYLRRGNFDAVLVADYGKGFVDSVMARAVVKLCGDLSIVCVADPRLPPACWKGALLKCNLGYATAHGVQWHDPAAVVTCGAYPPLVLADDADAEPLPGPAPAPGPCVNHVGAGDCFAAVLTLALAHGLGVRESAAWAHAAGRVYVRHPRGRPPYPHEVRREHDPAGGKVLSPSDLGVLKDASPGRVVFTNGVFRVPHAGHAWLLRWARAQGDALVVGVNDDASAARLRPGEVVLPLADRLEVLAGLGCVDWVVPFTEDTPEGIIGQLQPALLVKGREYAGRTVPGAGQVPEVRFAPESPYPCHATDLLKR